MPNAIPLASLGVLLGENGHPDGHPTGGVFKLEAGNIGQPGNAGGNWDTHTIKFGILSRYGIVFVYRDGTNILMVSCSGIDEPEVEGRRVGHGRGDAGGGKRGSGGRGGRAKDAFLPMTGKKFMKKRHAEWKPTKIRNTYASHPPRDSRG